MSKAALVVPNKLLGEPCSTVGLDYLCSTVTKAIKLFTVGNNGNRSNQVGLDYLCTMATKLFTLGNHGNYGNQVLYFMAKTTYRHD
jgi:hypothetical protein